MKKSQGFTLIELMIVLVIVAIIALIAGPLLTRHSRGEVADTGGRQAVAVDSGSRYPASVECFDDNGKRVFFQDASHACYEVEAITGDKTWVIETDGTVTHQPLRCSVSCAPSASANCGQECR